MKLSREMLVVLGAAMLALAGCSDDTVASDAAATGGGGNGVCLPTSQIDHTDIVDDSTIVFYMRTGKPYVNKMSMPCANLKTEDGFAYETDEPQICSASQTIRVARSGNFCELGQFTPYTPPAKS